MGFRENIVRVEPFTISSVSGAGESAVSERPINGELVGIRYQAASLAGSVFLLTSGATNGLTGGEEKLAYLSPTSGTSVLQTYNVRTPTLLAISGTAITNAHVPIMLNTHLKIATSGLSAAAGAVTVKVDILYR